MTALDDLMQIRFTKNEARTYLALLELGEAQTGKLCNHLKIPNSHIYRILTNLMEKGIVSYKLKNNIKIFKANNPETLNTLYLQKVDELKKHQEQIQSTITNIKSLKQETTTQSDYKYFEGISGIKSMWTEMASLLKKNTDSIIYTCDLEVFKSLDAFYLEYHKKRVEKQIPLRMILPTNAKEQAEERLKLGFFDVQFHELENEAEFGVCDDILFIQHTKGKIPRSFLIKDKVFAQTFASVFNKIWEKLN